MARACRSYSAMRPWSRAWRWGEGCDYGVQYGVWDPKDGRTIGYYARDIVWRGAFA